MIEKKQNLTSKDKIVQAAQQEFFQFGYTNVTVDQVAKAAGVSKKTIYQYFNSKEDIFWEIMLCRKNEKLEMFNEIYNLDVDFLEKMRLIGYRNAKDLCSSPILFLKDLRRNAPELSKKVEQMKREIAVKVFEDFYKRGLKENYFRKDIPVDIVVEMYYSMMQHMFTIAINSEKHSMEELYDYLSMIFFEGVFSREGFKKYNRLIEETEQDEN
ncbi:TetR/AcrR family transcriptional regulator [bacterium]|nr:MAG: TetR/AcrR family transcriptional regulator [bacterium]